MAIISFKYKYVFLKTRKVAGTSVEAALRPMTGPQDIVPGVTPRDEFHSASKGDFSKNYLVNPKDEEHYTNLVLKKRFDEATEFLKAKNKKAVSHMSYQRIESLISSQGFDISEFYVFTIERHPYSWLVSKCLYSNDAYNSGSLSLGDLDVDEINRRVMNFLNRDTAPDMLNWPMYTKGGKVAVDKVLKYENLSVDLKEVLERIGLGSSCISLPDLKNNARHIDAFSVLKPSVKEKAQLVFSNVFGFMGYEK